MATGSPILQSGSVTPGHVVVFVTDGVAGDSGISLGSIAAVLSVSIPVNFNTPNTDNLIPISLPVGFTRYRVRQILISGATGTLTLATCGVFTQPGAGGVAIVSSGTSVMVTSTAPDAPNNMQSLMVVGQNITAFSDTAIYFRVQANSGPGVGNVTVAYEPLP